LNAINLPDSVANLYFRPPSPDLQTLLYTTPGSNPTKKEALRERASSQGFPFGRDAI